MALVVGSIAGAFGITLYILIGALRLIGPDFINQFGLLDQAEFFEFAFAGWAIGLALIGAPLWWLAHSLHWRGWLHSMILGFFATFLSCIVWNYSGFNLSGWHGWVDVLPEALVFSVFGTCVGLIIWRVAYRKL